MESPLVERYVYFFIFHEEIEVYIIRSFDDQCPQFPPQTAAAARPR